MRLSPIPGTSTNFDGENQHGNCEEGSREKGGSEKGPGQEGGTGTRQLRCIALSADAMAEQIDAARAAGFDDYWTKPIDVPQVLAGLDRVLA